MSKRNALIEYLYEASSSKDENGLSVFDEQKMRRELSKNKNFMRKNKDIFAEGEPRFHTCKMYDPCPLCEKCKVKASHLYVKCQNCQINLCVHTDKDIRKMIIRPNFELKLKRPEFISAFKNLKKVGEEFEK